MNIVRILFSNVAEIYIWLFRIVKLTVFTISYWAKIPVYEASIGGESIIPHSHSVSVMPGLKHTEIMYNCSDAIHRLYNASSQGCQALVVGVSMESKSKTKTFF